MNSCSNIEEDNFTETYQASIRQVHLNTKLSDATNPLHRQWLGRKIEAEGNLESDAYIFGFSMDSLSLDRKEGNTTRDRSRLVTLGSTYLETLVSQWPSPLLVGPSFIHGDPNAPLLVVRVEVTEVSVTEHLEFLQKLFAPIHLIQKPPTEASLPLQSRRLPIPRLALDVHCGKISGRLICSDPVNEESFAVELRTDGFSIGVTSHFLPESLAIQRYRTSSNMLDDGLSLQMDFQLAVILKPVFVRICELRDRSYRYSKLPTSTLYLLDDPPILSLETVEIKGRGSAPGNIRDEDDIVYVDFSSMFVDMHCSVDAVGIELWHAAVIAAAVKLLSVFHVTQPETSLQASRPRLIDRLPVGYNATISFARFVLLITAPDLNPSDDLDLSRGLAFCAGFSVQYCALHAGHAQRFRGLPIQSQTRHKLYLPEERIVEAVAAAKAFPITQLSCAFLRLSTWDLSLRSAVSTQYAIDDPYIVERDNLNPDIRECLRIRSAKVDISLSGKHGSAIGNASDMCQVTLSIPYVRGEFQLAHVYSTLLAMRTLGLLLCTPRYASPGSPSGILYQVQGNVKTIQIIFRLPEQKLAMRIDFLSSRSSYGRPTRINWNTLLLWVVVPSQNKWDDNVDERWEELCRFQEWDVTLPRLDGETSSISVQGDSGRLRIPSGYVLADLIQAIGISIKGTRHLMHVVAAGCYATMLSPEAEAAKLVPHLALRVRCFFLEASDDPLESKLNLIWRAGVEASKQRLHREEAFLLKIATIMAADSSDASTPPLARDLEHDYNFSSNYSVSIEDARQRLYQVHAADWNLTHRLLKEGRSRSEEINLERLKGTSTAKAATDIPNIVPVSPVDRTPPLFRVMLNDLSLNITPPSFPLNTLPDFLFEQGRGLPRDRQFSLLIPMHLGFSLSSLRVTLRDYPLPLADIPPNTVTDIPVWEFNTDLVIAEEMGTPLSVDWIDCVVIETHYGMQGAAPLSISIPKTIMPVKTYANADIRVSTSGVTAFSWGVSYGAATQDLIRVMDTLSSSPNDLSPSLGFWDKVCQLLHGTSLSNFYLSYKMRLVFHWTIKVSFRNDVRLHMKGLISPFKSISADFSLQAPVTLTA
jgi:hypothetical protein